MSSRFFFFCFHCILIGNLSILQEECKTLITAEYWKAQDDIIALSDDKKNKKTILDGSQHTAKTNTMATDIFRAFLSLFKRCFLAFTEGSPGIFCDSYGNGKVKYGNQNQRDIDEYNDHYPNVIFNR